MTSFPFDVDDARVRETFLRQGLFAALGGLRADTPPRWGRMTAHQMLEHLLWTYEASTGRFTVECPYPEEKQQRLRPFLYQNTPSPREFRNPVLANGLPALRFPDLPAVLPALRAEVDLFFDECARRPDTMRMHPAFGLIPLEEWSRMHYKHGHHHLLQFGLIEQASGA